MNLEEIKQYCQENELQYEIVEEYNELKKGSLISQSIKTGEKIEEESKLIITISLGLNYSELKVNELGNVPIMMYHGIQDIENKYTGGNIDSSGYHRTAEAFRNDLEFYYENNYRMIRLEDYVNGIIKVEAGYSPIILTFDDGLSNNFKVLGIDESGELIIDPNSAVGILEEFKKKYPDFNITATFFLNSGLFNQSKYNEEILNWLIENNYDIGNHSYTHANISNLTKQETEEEIAKMYNKLDEYIPNEYVNIVALPYGSPYKKEHENFENILNSNYNEQEYNTQATLRVGWESEYSPFDINFDQTFLKRIRAYDNNGNDFDIEMNFKILTENRYISDGDEKTIAIPENLKTKLNENTNLEIITY